MTLLIRGWDRWQGHAYREVRRKRAEDSKRPLRLAFISVAAELYDDPEAAGEQGSFEVFAGLVGGKQAEALWLRVLQFVALRDPGGGSVPGMTRETLGPLALSRPWDQVTKARGGVVWDSLLTSELAEWRGASARGPRADGAETARKPRAFRAGGLGLGLEEKSKTAVTVDVDPPPTPPKATAVGEPGQGPTATACSEGCSDGLLPDGSFCRACGRGTRRRAAYGERRGLERSAEAKAKAARAERGAYAPEPGSLEEGAA